MERAVAVRSVDGHIYDLGILDDLPVLVRAPAKAAIGDGIQLNLQLNGLCRYVS